MWMGAPCPMPVRPPGAAWLLAVPWLESFSMRIRLDLSGASGSVIWLNVMLESEEPRGDHTAGSVPLVKKMNRYFALPACALAGSEFKRETNGEKSAARPRCRVKSRRVKCRIGGSDSTFPAVTGPRSEERR